MVGAQRRLIPQGVAARGGAQERTRTSTAVTPLVPETSASTNSATWAGKAGHQVEPAWALSIAAPLGALCFTGGARGRYCSPAHGAGRRAAMSIAAGAGKPGDGVRRLGLRRPACRAGAGARRLARCAPPCAGPTLPATCSRWARSARSMPCRPTCAIPTRCAARSRAPSAVVNLVGILAKAGAADLRGRARGGRPRRRQGRARRPAPRRSCTSRRSAPTASRRRRYGRTKAAGEAAVLAGISRRGHPAPVAGVRAGGPALQPLRRRWRASRRSCR